MATATAAPAKQQAGTRARVRAMADSAVYREVAREAGLSAAEVRRVFEIVGGLAQRQLGRRGPGKFRVPGLCLLTKARRPATRARPGRNPFTGEAITVPAKPARNVVRARAIKPLRDLI